MPSDKFGILFDLDQTLVDSQCVKQLRDSRNWPEVNKNLHQVKPYGGISALLSNLKEENIKICIITSSPRPYCEKIILQNKWEIDAVVTYHDTINHKPHPDPIFFGLKKIGITPNHALSIGDLPRDIISSKNAGVTTVGVTWGCENIDALVSTTPDKICNSVKELEEYIHVFFQNC